MFSMKKIMIFQRSDMPLLVACNIDQMKRGGSTMGKGLTLTIIFQAGSLNYGEGFGNISELKKVSRNNGQVYTYVSRQCLRYDMVRLGHELFGWNLQTVDNEQGTIQ